MQEDGIGFWKNLFLIVVFFAVTPVTIFISIISLFTFKSQPVLAHPTSSGVRVYASLPSQFPTVDGEITASDARVQIVKNYLLSYSSPLSPYADSLVVAADENGLDYRLLVAIAQQESNLCKVIPEGSYNCWGWGIHSKGSLGFGSFEEGINTVATGIKKEYIDKGFVTVEDIMSKYTPLSNGSWAYGVNLFMSQME